MPIFTVASSVFIVMTYTPAVLSPEAVIIDPTRPDDGADAFRGKLPIDAGEDHQAPRVPRPHAPHGPGEGRGPVGVLRHIYIRSGRNRLPHHQVGWKGLGDDYLPGGDPPRGVGRRIPEGFPEDLGIEALDRIEPAAGHLRHPAQVVVLEGRLDLVDRGADGVYRVTPPLKLDCQIAEVLAGPELVGAGDEEDDLAISAEVVAEVIIEISDSLEACGVDRLVGLLAEFG